MNKIFNKTEYEYYCNLFLSFPPSPNSPLAGGGSESPPLQRGD